MISKSNNRTIFPYNLLLAGRKIAEICQAFANNLPGTPNMSNTKISKIIQLGEFLS